MKRILSFVLAVCLVLGLSVGVFAATLDVSADKTDIKPGDEVTVTVSAKDAFIDYTALQYRLFYDADLFDINLKTDVVNKGSHVVVAPQKAGSEDTYIQIVMADTDAMEVLDIPAGTVFATLKFTAKSDIKSVKDAKFELKFIEATDKDYAIVKDNKPDAGAAVTVPGGSDQQILRCRFHHHGFDHRWQQRDRFPGRHQCSDLQQVQLLLFRGRV